MSGEIIGAFVAGAIFARFVTSSKRSAIDHALEGPRGLPPRRPPAAPPRPVIRGGCIFPNGEELPPIPRPTSSLVPVIDDPTLGPDQVMRVNGEGGDSSASGWPT